MAKTEALPTDFSVVQNGFEELKRARPGSLVMTLDAGTTLGSYQVTAKIGESGMGEVYRAVSDCLQVVLSEAEGPASKCSQTAMRESGPHQTPFAMSVQPQKEVAELVSEDPSQSLRIDWLVDSGELLPRTTPFGPKN